MKALRCMQRVVLGSFAECKMSSGCTRQFHQASRLQDDRWMIIIIQGARESITSDPVPDSKDSADVCGVAIKKRQANRLETTLTTGIRNVFGGKAQQ